MIRSRNRAVPVVLAAVTVDVIGFGVVMPVLPALVTQLGHLSLAGAARMSGWLLATFAAAQFVAGPVLGQLADRFGRRPVLVASMAAFSLDYLLTAAAPNLLWLFVGRVVAGAAGATFGPAGAVIADVTPPDRRAAAFGLLGAAFGVGFVVGPALGGLAAQWGVRAPFAAAAALAALNALAMLVALPETLKPENRRPFRWRDAHVVGALRPLFAAGAAAPLLAAWFLCQLAGAVYPATWSFWAAIRFDWDAAAIGWSLAWVGLLAVAVQLGLTPRAIRRLGERRAALLGLGAGAAGDLAYAAAARGWQVYAVTVVGSLGNLAYPALNGLLSRMVDETRQGALQGGIAAMTSVASVLGPLVAAQALGWGAARGQDGAAFVAAAALVGAAMLVIALGVPHMPPGPEPDATATGARA